MSRTICIDFDGVVHAYSRGWTSAGDVYDEPVPGAFEFIRELKSAGYTVVIQSARAHTAEGKQAIVAWLARHGYPNEIAVTSNKPPALAYIDDRAMRFDGKFPSLHEVEAATRPWHTKTGTQRATEQQSTTLLDAVTNMSFELLADWLEKLGGKLDDGLVSTDDAAQEICSIVGNLRSDHNASIELFHRAMRQLREATTGGKIDNKEVDILLRIFED